MASGLGPKVPGLLGVVGAGQMGAGIAQISAMKGVPVVLADVSQQSLDRGLATIHRSLARQVQKTQTTQPEAHQAAQRISTSISLQVLLCIPDYLLEVLLVIIEFSFLQALENCDFVIEAASENEKLKRSIFEQLSKVWCCNQSVRAFSWQFGSISCQVHLWLPI